MYKGWYSWSHIGHNLVEERQKTSSELCGFFIQERYAYAYVDVVPTRLLDIFHRSFFRCRNSFISSSYYFFPQDHSLYLAVKPCGACHQDILPYISLYKHSPRLKIKYSALESPAGLWCSCTTRDMSLRGPFFPDSGR